MKRASFSVLAFCVLLAFGNGCRKSDPNTTDPKAERTDPDISSPVDGAAPTTGKNLSTPKKEEPDVPALLQKGGKNWSAPATAFDLDPFKETGGDRLWIWPSEDKVVEIIASDPQITLEWKLRPGHKAVDTAEAQVVMAEIRGKTAGSQFGLRGSTEGVKEGATEGKCVITVGMAIKDYRGEGELLLFITVKGIKPASNLLRIKTKIVD